MKGLGSNTSVNGFHNDRRNDKGTIDAADVNNKRSPKS